MTAARITRSPGLSTGCPGLIAGGGYSGATESLDSTVQECARALAEAYDLPVMIRFNSDRRSGGAFLRTDDPDGIWLNAEVGICADTHRDSPDEVMIFAHVGRRVGEYTHKRMGSIASALDYVKTHADLTKLDTA